MDQCDGAQALFCSQLFNPLRAPFYVCVQLKEYHFLSVMQTAKPQRKLHLVRTDSVFFFILVVHMLHKRISFIWIESKWQKHCTSFEEKIQCIVSFNHLRLQFKFIVQQVKSSI
jgi:hypothetical protein